MAQQLELFGARQLVLFGPRSDRLRRSATMRRPPSTAPAVARRPHRSAAAGGPPATAVQSPDVTMLAVDLENLVGRWACRRRGALLTVVAQVFEVLPEARFTTIAGHHELFSRALPALPASARLRPASGLPDAADRLLLADLRDVPASVGHVVIASGDHAFVGACRRLQHTGRTVTIIGRRGSVSGRLAAAADHVTELRRDDLTVAA